MGVAGFVTLVAIVRREWLFDWWWFVFVIVGVLFSLRSGRAWSQGRGPDLSAQKTSHPTVAVEGKAGATYVLLEPARIPKAGSKVKPREFSPGWWALYSAIVRAPVHFGDFILTIFWRFSAGLWGNTAGSPSEQGIPFDAVDAPARTRPPSDSRF